MRCAPFMIRVPVSALNQLFLSPEKWRFHTEQGKYANKVEEIYYSGVRETEMNLEREDLGYDI
jgi:hypothetical protein